MLRSFERPDLTAEQWAEIDRRAEQWERETKEAVRRERAERSGIPKRFRAASFDGCPDAAKEWAEERPTSGLILKGVYGSGKTHTACAVLLHAMDFETARFVHVDDLLLECKATWSGRDTEEAVIARYANVGILCLDDLGKERMTEWSLPILFAIIDRRWANERPTVVTTNYAGRQLMERMTVNDDATTAKAIISRMASFTSVTIDGGDRRLAS